MTCIVGMHRDGITAVAADSLSMSGHIVHESKREKLQQIGIHPIVMGITGPIRVSNLIRQLEVDSREDFGGTLVSWAIYVLVPAFRKLLIDAGLEGKDSDGYVDYGLTALVADRTGVVEIDTLLGVEELAGGFSCIGMGHEIARGVLTVLPDDRRARAAVREAVEAASEWCVGVGGTIRVVEITEEGLKWHDV